jgi:lactoylglutathione lyase
MRVNYCIILVSSMPRSVAFYRDVVGMPLRFESPDWIEFNTDGATWALHSCDSAAPAAAGLRAETIAKRNRRD